MVGIVDYGMGNLRSVYNAFEYLGFKARICETPESLATCDRIVIPGVGAFQDCIEKLTQSGFVEALIEETIQKAKPTMGICLGMQVMATFGFEGGLHKGLGWFDAEVIKLSVSEKYPKVPNIGWNEVEYRVGSPLFKGLPKRVDLYLVHSFYMQCKMASDIVATYDFGFPVTAAVLKNNIFATQFHPEKSQDYGLQILDNFMQWKP